MKTFLASLLFGLLLVGCATTGSTPQDSLAQATKVYNVASSVVKIYVSLPRCGTPTATQICSDRATVIQLAAADSVAYDALVAAERAVKAGAPNMDVLLAAALAATTTLSTQASGVKP